MWSRNVYYSASHVWDREQCVTALCSSCSLPKYVGRWRAALYEAGRSVLMSVNGSKTPRFELNTVHLYQPYSLFMHNKLLYTLRGYYCVCEPCPNPRLNRSLSSVPPRTISMIHSPPGPCRMQQINNCKKAHPSSYCRLLSGPKFPHKVTAPISVSLS